jgi:uncharacterized repeat protein (TIGR01451 family)
MTQPKSAILSFLKCARKRNGQGRARQRRPIPGSRLAIERLEDRSLPSISGVGFYGLAYDSTQGLTPPDTIAAAGPNHVVEAVNENLFFGSKATLPNSLSGTVQSFDNFFPGFTHSLFGLSDVISDPSVNYDAATGKWIISILDIDLQNDKGYLNIAVSNTSDPTGGWAKFQLDLTDGHGPLIPGNAGLTLWGDFERFGSSANAYIWTVNMFSFSAGGIDQNSLFDHVQVIAIDKSNLANVHTVDLPSWDSTASTITNANLLPVRMDGAAAADGAWFAEETNYGTSSGQANTLRLVHVADILTATPNSFVDYTGNVPLYQFTFVPDPAQGGNHPWNNGDAVAPAGQKGSADLIETNDTRINSAVWRTVNGQQHLVLTQTVDSTADPGVAKARWYDFNTTGATDPSVAVPLYQSGEINPGAGVFTYFPSAAIDPAGDIGMTYLESSATTPSSPSPPGEYLSMYVTGKALAESAMEPAVLVVGGSSADTGPDGSPHRAGDYSGTVVDINSAGAVTNSFWSANEYADGGVWATALENFTITNPLPSTDMAVTASGPSSVTAGTNATYTITITNNGPNPAQGVVMTDTLPAGSTYVSITQTSGSDSFTFSQSGGTVTATAAANIATGSSDTFTVAVFAPASLSNGATFNDAASVSASNPDPNTANNSATVSGSIVNNNPNADLAVQVTGPATANEGDSVTYNITVTNAGPSSASGVILTDTLPSNLSYKSSSSSQGTVSVSNGVVTFSVGTVAAGGTVTASVTALAVEDGNVANTASVSSSNPDPASANNSANATTSFAEPAIKVSAPIKTRSRTLSNFQVATFTHANAVEPANAFTATINWGDGTTSSGAITLSGTTYTVTGSHTYSNTARHTITTSVTEVAGAGGIKLHGRIGRGADAVLPLDTLSTLGATLSDQWLPAPSAFQWPEQLGASLGSDRSVAESSFWTALAAAGRGVSEPGVASSQRSPKVFATPTVLAGSGEAAVSDLYFSLGGQFDAPADPSV